MKALDQFINGKYAVYNADCIDVMAALPDHSMHFSLYSPPFASLYIYSDNPRDLSNSSTEAFFEHYQYVVKELYRLIKPGRIVAVHVTQLPATYVSDGYVGMYDFRGDIIRAHQKAGFIYHSEVCIWRDPHTTLKLTKTKGLYHKNIIKDGVVGRHCWADYILAFKHPHDNLEPVAKKLDVYYGDDLTDEEHTDFVRANGKLAGYSLEDGKSMEIWNRYAEPVWMDISRTDVLSKFEARGEDDEKHITPLQLTPIRRCIQLWTNPNDIIFSPFAGIGSVGYVAVEMGRRFVGAELKESYYHQIKKNLHSMESQLKQRDFLTAD